MLYIHRIEIIETGMDVLYNNYLKINKWFKQTTSLCSFSHRNLELFKLVSEKNVSNDVSGPCIINYKHLYFTYTTSTLRYLVSI